MAEFETPGKENAILPSDTINIPPFPFLKILGYGTGKLYSKLLVCYVRCFEKVLTLCILILGVAVMQLVRSPRSPWAFKMFSTRLKSRGLYIHQLVDEANLLRRMSHRNIVGFRAFSR